MEPSSSRWTKWRGPIRDYRCRYGHVNPHTRLAHGYRLWLHDDGASCRNEGICRDHDLRRTWPCEPREEYSCGQSESTVSRSLRTSGGSLQSYAISERKLSGASIFSLSNAKPPVSAVSWGSEAHRHVPSKYFIDVDLLYSICSKIIDLINVRT